MNEYLQVLWFYVQYLSQVILFSCGYYFQLLHLHRALQLHRGMTSPSGATPKTVPAWFATASPEQNM
eukprot:SAG31_NODE_5853_length_2295_cov_1.872040_2_plen_67_part_00